ncbi:tail completion protein gp17 [Acinetobacter sp. ANC 5383]
MSHPNIFQLLAADQLVKNLVQDSSGIIRTWAFGAAPDDPKLPYVVWQTVSGSTFNNIDDRPSGDRLIIQFDCYSTDIDEIEKLKDAVRHAIELNCNIVSLRDVSHDAITGIYHIGFDVIWIVLSDN